MTRGHLTLLLGLMLPSATEAAPAGSPGGPARARPYGDHQLVMAQPRTDAEVTAIWELAEHVLEPHDPARAPHRLVVTAETLQRLRALRIPLQVDARDVQSWITGLSEGSPPRSVDFEVVGKLGIFGDFFATVRNLEAIEARLDELAAASGGRAKVVVLGKSFQGRDIKAMRISSAPEPASSQSRRASIVVVAAQHAREWAAPVVAMGIIEALIRQYEVDPRVKRVVDNLDIYVNPVNNPDGYVATFNGQRLQRKNLNSACNVDLNRNYETAWGAGTASAGCNSGNYPGRSAFSEPESQAIKRLIESLPRPALFYDYHSTAAQVMIPYAHTLMPAPGLEKNRALCELYASALRELYGTTYPARPGFNLGRGQGGGAFDWFRAKFAETMVVELGGGFGFSISDPQVLPFAEENFVAWLAVAQKVADENPADGASATDAGSRPAPDAAGPNPDAPPPPADAGAPPPGPDASGQVSGPAPPTGGGLAPGAPPGGNVPPGGNGLAPAPPGSGSGPATGEEILAGCQCALDRRAPPPAAPALAAATLALAALTRRRRRR